LFAALADASVNVDTIVQTSSEIVFSAPVEDRPDAAGALDSLGVQWSARDDLGKVSLVGAGMKSHPGVAAKTFATLEAAGIDAPIVSTSPIKIACHVASADVERGGAIAVDKSSAYRLQDGAPLVVPEVNGARALEHDGIVANPNCCSIPLTMALKPLLDAAGLTRVRVSTYQSASGAGAGRMEQLR